MGNSIVHRRALYSSFGNESINKTTFIYELSYASVAFLTLLIKLILKVLTIPPVTFSYSVLTHFLFLGNIINIDPMIGFIHFNEIIITYMVITMRASFIISSHVLQLTYSNIKYILIHKTFVNRMLCVHILILINILLLCSGTVHPNPGWVFPDAYEQNILSVCHWNLNGLLANNFVKNTLLEAFLETYKYDIVILSETFITSKIKTDQNGLKTNGYTMKRCDHPSDDPRGGIYVYHKKSLPLK